MLGLFKRKLSVGFLLGFAFTNLVWNPFQALVNLNVEKTAETYGLDRILQNCVSGQSDCGRASVMWVGEKIAEIGLFLTGHFGLGFALGSVLFAFWDPIALNFPRLFGKSKAVILSERAKVWREVGEAITNSLIDTNVEFEHPTMGLPASTSDDERSRIWSRETNRHIQESQRQLAVLNRRHNSDLQMALSEISHLTGDDQTDRHSYQVNAIGWKMAANFLIAKASEVESV
ncbi:hypothetical protein ACGYK1_19010 [Sulfitobacter sp. 1A13191]|uniref:hypothetical protein n=1 Tax=Sulfitobacter sp. 1A13191 TaxID=3368589 RepID=UPI0037457C87